ncbi:MAG TPA: hypothetical protein VHT95_03300 [Vicinamibacterales bacterium]|nr:hypothetical protein [Vicinamibacterales bacterium]
MNVTRAGHAAGLREFGLVVLGAALMTAALTYPTAFKIGRVGRVDNGDGKLSIWNVAWVARTLVSDPLHVYDANIFYPHRGTLAYSENNLGAGALAVPVYWATRNPYAALNFAMLLAFTLSGTGMYYLVRYLTGDRRAAVVSAIGFAFCPFVFAHTAHIQLLMTAGLPFTLLAFHRVADRPSAGRGAALGAAMAAQAMCCGYYGVFVCLMVGFAVAAVAVTRRLWTASRYWMAILIAAATAVLLVIPAFLPYLTLQRVDGFRRELKDSVQYSANWSDYLASSSYAHAWMLGHLPAWSEVSFPGFVTLIFGVWGAWVAARERRRELLLLYGGLTLLAFWASFGPRAILYSALYRMVPMFAWLRAPARFGLVVAFGLSVLAGIAISAWLRRSRRPALVTAALVIVAAGELAVPIYMPEAPPVEPVYRTLATLPRGPVIEMPFFYPEVGLFQHTKYMLASTAHWMPMVNGYSDYIPPDFYDHVMLLAPFPSRDAFKILEPNRVRYAVFHMNGYNAENRNDVLTRLEEFKSYLRPLYTDDNTRLYEIVGFPP